jgi:hypothetical protein
MHRKTLSIATNGTTPKCRDFSQMSLNAVSLDSLSSDKHETQPPEKHDLSQMSTTTTTTGGSKWGGAVRGNTK